MNLTKGLVLIGVVIVGAFADIDMKAPTGLAVRDAQAIVGAPLTPMSVAGVARRTTRAVVATEVVVASSASASAAASATAQQQKAVAQQQAATAQQQAAVAQQQAAVAQQQAQAAGVPAIGSVVPALPAGCTAVPINGVEHYRCGNVLYRSAFQGNNLVYVVVPQP